MNKKFEDLDSLILGQPESIDLNEVTSTPEGEAKTQESEITEVAPKLRKDGQPESIDLDAVTHEDEKIEVKGKTEDKEVVETLGTEEEFTEEKTDPKEALTHWTNYFKESSILAEDDLEGFDGSMEALSKAFEKREVRVGLEMVEDYKSQLPAMIKYLAENWEEGVPLTDLLNIKSNQIKYSNVTDEKLEESVDTQKAIYTDYLKKTSKFSDSKIEKEVNRLLDLEELKGEAKEALIELKKIEVEAEETIRKETKKEQERRKEENHNLIKSYEKTSKEIKEIIPGIKLTEKEQREIFELTVNPIGLDGFGNQVSYMQSLRMPDPASFDIKANYFAKITKGYTDFSKITNSITTKTTRDLSNLVNTPPPNSKKDNIATSEKKGILDYLSLSQNKTIIKK